MKCTLRRALTLMLSRPVVLTGLGLAFLGIAGCAVQQDPRLNATGYREQEARTVPFATSQELLFAGLVDDAIGLAVKNRFFEAEARLRQATFLQPDNERAMYNLALVLNQTSQSEESEQILENLNARRPNTPNYMFGLADAEAAQQKYSEAIEHLKQLFRLLKTAKNTSRMATVARSISNLAFRAGDETEALCYSYEAFALAPSPEQLGYHSRLMVALGYFESARLFTEAQLKVAPELGKRASVKHALAVGRFMSGDSEGALAAENQALDFVKKEPDLGGEINATWFVLRNLTLTGEEGEKELEVMEQARSAALDFREVGTEYRLFLAPKILIAIDAIEKID